MTAPVRALGVAVLAGLTLLPALTPRMVAPANHGAHGLTTGFGRGRLDVQGLVSEGSGGSVDLPHETAVLTMRLSGDGPINLRGKDLARSIVASDAPVSVRLELSQGGVVSIDAASRIRLHDLVIERRGTPWGEVGILALLGILAAAAATRGATQAFVASLLLLLSFFAITKGRLSGTFTQVALAQLAPALIVVIVLLPLALALKQARFLWPPRLSPLSVLAFTSSLVVSGAQFLRFEQPLPMGDPAAYFEMGGKFADAMARLGSPLGLGPILSDIQPYLALPATGLLYGLLRLIGGLGVIYAAQALAMAIAVAGLVSICETEIGSRAARIALGIALLHPSFSILPGIVQPEPFILAAWILAASVTLRCFREASDPRGLLAAGVLFGLGLALHPQGLSFLLLALGLCLLPWASNLVRRPALLAALMLGALGVLLPVAAAEHFSKPLAYVLDKEYGFFAYTSPHPLGFWLYVDSDGWQGPLRIEDTTYQRELIAMKGEGATSSTFADVALFVSRHPGASAQALLTNLHRLWHQPDNPFAVPFVLPYGLQIPLQRGLVVLFIISLPALLGSRLAILALPFVMLSMTYPAYHVFNKYATPALPFTVIGAAYVVDRIVNERERLRAMIAGLACAAVGALLSATVAARLGMPGSWFMVLVRGLLWIGLGVALVKAIRDWGSDARSRFLAAVIGAVVLLGSSFAAARTDTTRGAWSMSLDQPFEVVCRIQPEGAGTMLQGSPWILIDAQSKDGAPPRIEANGRALQPPVPTMPTFGLASVRGRRDPATFRQIWRTRLDESLLAPGELSIRVRGEAGTRVFGDIRAGGGGPRLSLGNWPWLSVYRLMHEGQYRLPTFRAPAQACVAQGLSGRPGISLVRISAGEETQLALKSAKPLVWIF